MSDFKVYGFCNANCKWEVPTTEQLYSILQQLMESGSLAGCDPALSPVVKLIQEQHGGKQLSLWMGTEAEFNALDPQPVASLVMLRTDANGQLYLCTDDSTLQGWYNKIILDSRAVIEETAAPLIKQMQQIAGNVQVTADVPMHLSVTAAGGLRISYDNGVSE